MLLKITEYNKNNNRYYNFIPLYMTNLPGNPVNLSNCSYACPINISNPLTVMAPDSSASLKSLVILGV